MGKKIRGGTQFFENLYFKAATRREAQEEYGDVFGLAIRSNFRSGLKVPGRTIRCQPGAEPETKEQPDAVGRSCRLGHRQKRPWCGTRAAES